VTAEGVLPAPLPAAHGEVPGWLTDADAAPERLTVAALAEKFTPVCQSAVDPLEVASALEFEGYGDRAAREDYGVKDVFALANVLYRRVPRSPAEPEPSPDPWQISRLRPLLHGLLYAMPAVCFPAVGGLLAGEGVLPTLVVALFVAWGLSQGLACVGYLRLGSAGLPQARRVLRSGLIACLLLVAVAMVMMRLTVAAHPIVLMFGAGEGVYMLGASVLMVTGAEPWLLIALAPGVLGSSAFLYLGRPHGSEHAAWAAALIATPLLACALAWRHTRTPKPRAGRMVTLTELRTAVPAIAFGVVAAALLTFPVIAGPHGHGGVNPGALVSSIPLSLSMGAAEWSLLWYRRRTRRLLQRVREIPVFRVRARGYLLAALIQYLAGTTVLIGISVAIAAKTNLIPVHWSIAPEAAAYLVLGAAMFLALLLQTMRVRFVPLTVSAAGLVTEIVLRYHGTVVQLAVPAALLIIIGGYAMSVLGAAVRHAN
jgi:hypothetical protein